VEPPREQAEDEVQEDPTCCEVSVYPVLLCLITVADRDRCHSWHAHKRKTGFLLLCGFRNSVQKSKACLFCTTADFKACISVISCICQRRMGLKEAGMLCFMTW
jgi:hypothetical protein